MPIHILAQFITARWHHDKWQYQPFWGQTP